MTKLIITGGCSVGDQECKDYKTEGGVTVWPTLLSELTNTKVLNVSKQGMGNDYIENTVFDAILKNKDKYDCTVLVYWTESLRINLFDTHTNMEIKKIICDSETDICVSSLGYDPYTVINKNFRNMKRIQLICNKFNIKCYHRLVYGFSYGSEVLKKWLGNHPAIEEFNLSYFELVGGRWSNRNNHMIENNQLHGGHPNQKMQYEIANMFIDTMNDVNMERLEKPAEMPGRDFVYD